MADLAHPEARALAASTATWRTVVGHHPVFTISGAGSELGRVKSVSRPGFAIERHGFVTARLSSDALALR